MFVNVLKMAYNKRELSAGFSACGNVQVERSPERSFSRGKFPLVGEKDGGFLSNGFGLGEVADPEAK